MYANDSCFDNFTKKLSLVKDKTVYIEVKDTFFKKQTNNIIISDAIIPLKIGEVVNHNQEENIVARFSVEESGLYRLSFIADSSTAFCQPCIKINDSSYALRRGGYTNVYTYADKDEPILITFDKLPDDINISYCYGILHSVESVTPPEITNDIEYSANAGDAFTFVPETGGFYQLKTNTGDGMHVFTEDDDIDIFLNLSYSYIYAEAGKKYIFSSRDPKTFSLTKKEFAEAEINEEISAELNNQDVLLYAIDIPADGYYKLNSDVHNSQLYAFYNNTWNYIKDNIDFVPFLAKGKMPIVIIGSAVQADGMTEPCANVIVKKAQQEKEPSISIENAYRDTNKSIKLIYRIELPYTAESAEAWIMCTDEVGTTIRIDIANLQFSNIESIYRSAEFNQDINKKWTFKPYLCADGETICGKERRYEGETAPVISDITSNRIDFYANSDSLYEYVFRFTQPMDADDLTTISYDEILRNISIYDSNGAYVKNTNRVDGAEIYSLIPGETYTIHAVPNVDGSAFITIDSLPGAEVEVSGISVHNNTIYFNVSGDLGDNAVMYGAIYRNNKLIEIKPSLNPLSETCFEFENLYEAEYCKLLIWDKNTLLPACQSTRIYIK